jgi:hypothetical protein
MYLCGCKKAITIHSLSISLLLEDVFISQVNAMDYKWERKGNSRSITTIIIVNKNTLFVPMLG